MTERLLQFIWQFRYFNHHHLCTEQQQTLQILNPGSFNSHQGPDFLNARIKVNETTWAGHIELHVKSSHWNLHKHTGDQHYDNVILHVVWENDTEPGLPFPTLELQSRVPALLLTRYEQLMQVKQFIPCQDHINNIPPLVISSWKERMMAERMEARLRNIKTYLSQNNQHWEETLWWLLARNFGITQNADAFESVARSLPLAVLAKHCNQVLQLEALLFGQAGLLNADFKEAYPQMLQREYNFLLKKYSLVPPRIPLQFLRMRPACFPTVRLAQLAVLVNQSRNLFSKIKEAKTLQEIKNLLNVTANDYWHCHYRFDEETAYRPKKMGAEMIQNIIINTVIPMVCTYAVVHSFPKLKERTLLFLEDLPPEKNSITSGFTQLGISNNHAYDSQALYHLKTLYCNSKRCLQCAVGNQVLKHGLQK